MTNENATATNLRQADAIVRVEGVLSEKSLELKTEDGKEAIKGSLTIQTSDINFITFTVNIGRLTKDNKENKLFAGMLTVMDQYKSIAEAGAEGATKIRVTDGQLNPYTYFNDSGRHDVIGFKSNFFNRINNTETIEPKAEFEVEIFIQSIMEEVNTNDETTGRLIINGLIPTYNGGIEPVPFIVPQEHADAINATYDVGQTVRIQGEINNSKVVKIIEIPVAIGKPMTKKTTSYKNELILTGISTAYEEGVDITPPYDFEVIKKAMAERDVALEEKKAKAQSGNKGATTTSTTSSSQNTKPKPSTNRNLPW